jgi:L-ascorbate metabolism protein UlaG (beta-lactamase superfamily)
MQVEWYGQSAFRLADGERTLVFDPRRGRRRRARRALVS